MTSAVNVVVVAHHTRQEVVPLIRQAEKWLQKNGHQMWMPKSDASALGLDEFGSDRSAQDADLLISLGGDGTILRSVELLGGAPVPILGVNMGTLGYLTEIEPEDLLERLERWINQDDKSEIVLDERMMLAVTLKSKNKNQTWRALNEAVIERQQSGHTVWLDVTINHELFARYSADGVIVATPTGSTAYSMSARGPVVSPRHRAMLLTPVSPHMLFDRSLVLGPTEMLSMQVVGTRPAELAIDGRHVASLDQGDVVSYEADSCSAHFVRFTQQPKFHQIVRAKFGLGDE
ncbi:MAG: NAD(+)/NADH kinase [Actinomycetota bacterium]|nr:NAD(+)/NADH kinase [Actinomycetota bacterium]